MGDIVDMCGPDGSTFSRCRGCGSDRFQVTEGVAGIAVAFLTCLGCRRSQRLHRAHFGPGGRHPEG
jgi:hypothetical protein